MNQRAFTLLETILAAGLGAAVIAVCIGLFGALDRTDRGTALRFDQTSALSRVHLVMRRTFANIVMSDSSVRGGGAASGGSEGSPAPRPRIFLDRDTSPSAERAARALGSGQTPQRLEVVLSKPPVPSGLNSPRGEAIALSTYEPSIYAGPAVRGVFELRPDPTPIQARSWGVPGLDPRTRGWTLWWRPLPHNDSGPEGSLFTLDPEEDPRAVPVASGLTEFKWTAFSQRKRADAFEATQFQDLPAYMELQLRTTTGLTANWMFEVDWTNGPETQQELEEQQRLNERGPIGRVADGQQGETTTPDGTRTTDQGGRTQTTSGGRLPIAQIPKRLGTEPINPGKVRK